MLKTGGFWHRFLTAVSVSTLIFSPLYLWLFISTYQTRSDYESIWVTLVNGLDVFALGQAIIVATVLVIAYPVERFCNSEKKSPFRNAATYAFIGILFIAVFYAITFANFGSGNYLPIVGLYISIFGTAVAFIGRLIYPYFLKLKKLTISTTGVIVLLVSGALFFQPISADSPNADGFYPKTFTGEIARVSNDVNEADGSGGMHQRAGLGKIFPDRKYLLRYQCREANGAKYSVEIRDMQKIANLAIVPIACDSTALAFKQVDLGTKATEVALFLNPLNGGSINGKSTHPDTWVVLTPSEY